MIKVGNICIRDELLWRFQVPGYLFVDMLCRGYFEGYQKICEQADPESERGGPYKTEKGDVIDFVTGAATKNQRRQQQQLISERVKS